MFKRNVFFLLSFSVFILLGSCSEEKEKKVPLNEITPLDVISYLKAHQPLDTSSVKISSNLENLIKVKQIEMELQSKWLKKYSEIRESGIANIWSRFGVLIDVISFEFKIIEFLELNPRIIFFKKEMFYRDLGIPFEPFANASPFYELVQKHLLFAANLLKNYKLEQIEEKLSGYFNRHPEYSDKERKALSFDLLRWYHLEKVGIIKRLASTDSSLK